jgi:hypothetical protein
MEIPLRFTQYQNSVYSYPQNETFRDILNPTNMNNFVPATALEFMNFVQRQLSVSLVFFANRKDPCMTEIVKRIQPYVTNINKLIVVDVGKIPTLGQKYNITSPTFMKIFKGHVVRIYTGDLSDQCAIKHFVFSTATWRSGEIR